MAYLVLAALSLSLLAVPWRPTVDDVSVADDCHDSEDAAPEQAPIIVPVPTANRRVTAKTTGYTWTGSRTATGTVPSWGTVAVDPSVIRYGTRLHIDGFGPTVFVAEDTGHISGWWVDIYFPTRAQALQHGVQYREIEILGG